MRVFPTLPKAEAPRFQVHVAPGGADTPPPSAETGRGDVFKPPGCFWTSSLTPKVSAWAEELWGRLESLCPPDPAAFVYETRGGPRVLVIGDGDDFVSAWRRMNGVKGVLLILPEFTQERFWELAREHYDAVRVPSGFSQSGPFRDWDTESTAWFRPERNLALVSKAPLADPCAFEGPRRDGGWPDDEFAAAMKAPREERPGVLAERAEAEIWHRALASGPIYRKACSVPGDDASGRPEAAIWCAWREGDEPDGRAARSVLSEAEARAEMSAIAADGGVFSVWADRKGGGTTLTRKAAGKLDGDDPAEPAVLEVDGDAVRVVLARGGRIMGKPFDLDALPVPGGASTERAGPRP